jgi:folate-binding protein YgfZ
MHETWATYLREQGAVIEHGVVRHFGNPQLERRARRERTLLLDLSTQALLRVGGADASAFLNAQLTNDIALLDAGRSQLSAWCSAQGRMLAVFRVFRLGTEYLLLLPATLQEEIVKRLRMFVLRSKVTIEDAGAQLVRLGLVGPEAERLLRDIGTDTPAQDNHCITHGDVTLLRLPGMHPRFQLIAPPARAMALWDELRAGATPVGTDAWAWHDIMAGLPSVQPQTREEFVPQMANLELIGGVNFKKGCYPGQEIVARMQYLGRLKQRMLRAHAPGDVVPAGTPVFAPGTSGQSVGQVVDAQESPDDGIDLLAVIQLAAVEAGELHLGSENGPRLEIASLPYTLDAAEPQKVS